MAEVRRGSWEGRLARLGFADPQRAGVRLEQLDRLAQLNRLDGRGPMATEQLITALSESADPDLALHGLCGLAEGLHRGVVSISSTLEEVVGAP